jgi:hypothetical protein
MDKKDKLKKLLKLGADRLEEVVRNDIHLQSILETAEEEGATFDVILSCTFGEKKDDILERESDEKFLKNLRVKYP